MDLGTIKERLRSSSYHLPRDFNRDVWLILNNAKVFYEAPEMSSPLVTRLFFLCVYVRMSGRDEPR